MFWCVLRKWFNGRTLVIHTRRGSSILSSRSYSRTSCGSKIVQLLKRLTHGKVSELSVIKATVCKKLLNDILIVMILNKSLRALFSGVIPHLSICSYHQLWRDSNVCRKHYKTIFYICGYGITAITSSFQVDDASSTLAIRSKNTNPLNLFKHVQVQGIFLLLSQLPAKDRIYSKT